MLTLPSGQELPDNEANRAFKRLVEEDMCEEQEPETKTAVPKIDRDTDVSHAPQLGNGAEVYEVSYFPW